MTLRKWGKLYDAYRNEWDKERIMNYRGQTYSDLTKEINIDDVIPI